MPDYPGSWNAAPLAPDLGQAPGAAPVLDLPVDGEPADAASIAQALQVLANHVAFGQRPTGIAGEWEDATRIYRSARGHRMLEVDHFGMPGGNVVRQQEDFSASYGLEITASGDSEFQPIASGAQLPGWLSVAKKTVPDLLQPPILAVYNPLSPIPDPSGATFTSPPWGRTMLMVAHKGVTDRALLARSPTWGFHSSIIGSMEWVVQEVANHSSGAVICGLVDTATMGVVAPLGPAQGLFFKADAGATWTCVTLGPGGATDSVVTAVNATSINARRMKIVWVGSGADDSSTARALFFIDDVLVANFIADLPGAIAAMPFFGVQQEVGDVNVNLLLRGSISINFASALVT